LIALDKNRMIYNTIMQRVVTFSKNTYIVKNLEISDFFDALCFIGLCHRLIKIKLNKFKLGNRMGSIFSIKNR